MPEPEDDGFEDAIADAERDMQEQEHPPEHVMVGNLKALLDDLDPLLPIFLASDPLTSSMSPMRAYYRLSDPDRKEVVGIVLVPSDIVIGGAAKA